MRSRRAHGLWEHMFSCSARQVTWWPTSPGRHSRKYLILACMTKRTKASTRSMMAPTNWVYKYHGCVKLKLTVKRGRKRLHESYIEEEVSHALSMSWVRGSIPRALASRSTTAMMVSGTDNAHIAVLVKRGLGSYLQS